VVVGRMEARWSTGYAHELLSFSERVGVLEPRLFNEPTGLCGTVWER
jgi:hypothetical protein